MDLQEFDTLAYRTSKARFNAAERLKRQGVLALYTSSIMSLAATMLAFNHTANYGYIAAIASSFALVFSLIESGSERAVKAERLHQCALTIRKLMYSAKATDANITDHVQAYHAAIDACQENHTPADLQLALNPNSLVAYNLKAYGVYWLLMAVASIFIVLGGI
jgi:CHAD domain-containing protein